MLSNVVQIDEPGKLFLKLLPPKGHTAAYTIDGSFSAVDTNIKLQN